jgi:hypothetical protein
MNLCAYFQRILGVARSPLALAEALQHTLLATQTSKVVTTFKKLGLLIGPGVLYRP